MNYKYFIGIDVSKNWLDLTVLKENVTVLYKRIDNSPEAITDFFKSLKVYQGYKVSQSLVCMEHTGIYNNHLLNCLSALKANICLESGLQINQSSGMKRGKNDKVDSLRIALYAYKNQKEIKLWQPRRAILESLKYLTGLRTRLVNALKQLKTPLKESTRFISPSNQKIAIGHCQSSIEALARDLKELNKQISLLIKSDPELNRLFKLASSVTGVGPVTAVEMIITTNEFTSITCSKKYACYSGVAPFEHKSGSSIRGKTRVSAMGNKTVKKLLHMAALSASICPGDLKVYFERKVAEGKNKMQVLNAMRNKIIARVFACVRLNRPYEKNYSKSLLYP